MDARTFLRAGVESLFRLLFTYDCLGEEHVPARGGAVVAANHPSYLDPVLLSLQLKRPILFMASEALFKVPLLGTLMRAFGAFPVDVRRGKGREAYEKAKALVAAGELVGIFPEGKRSRAGWMEESLREGAARLAWETGAPLVPATITGAFRAWPHFQSLPRPARVRVRFHPPIDPTPYRGLPEGEALLGLLGELRQRVERSLLPGVKADLRKEILYRLPGPAPRSYEVVPAVLAMALGLWQGTLSLVAGSALYVLYLFLDGRLPVSSRVLKWLRNSSPMLFGLALLPAVARALDAPPPTAPAALWAIVLGSAFPYLYARTCTALAFLRGFSLALLAEAVALAWWPSALGPHIAFAIYAAVFAASRRTVFWPYAATALVAYAGAVAAFLGASHPLLAHLAAAAVAWLATRLFPYDPAIRSRSAPSAEAVRGLRP